MKDYLVRGMSMDGFGGLETAGSAAVKRKT